MLREAGDGMDSFDEALPYLCSSLGGSGDRASPMSVGRVAVPRYVPWEPSKGSVDAYSSVVQEAIRQQGERSPSGYSKRIRHRKAVDRSVTMRKHENSVDKSTTGVPITPDNLKRCGKTIIVHRGRSRAVTSADAYRPRHSTMHSTYSTVSLPARLTANRDEDVADGVGDRVTLGPEGASDVETVSSSSYADVSRGSSLYKIGGEEEDEEAGSLHQQLKIQMEINSELKKLLVAAVGDDVHHKLDCLIHSKARMNHQLTESSAQTLELYEQMEKLSIQCDVYRSKFLAMKTMASELSAWKSSLLRKHCESQNAMQDLLGEHEEMRKYLAETYRELYQLKEQLYREGVSGHSPPASYTTESCNLLHLSASCHRLATHITKSLYGDASTHTPDRTTAEQKKPLETLSDETETDAEKRVVQLLSCGIQVAQPPSALKDVIERFHPHSNADLTNMTCCHTCKGDVKEV